MQVICQISGLPIYKTPYLLGFDLVDTHPIFRAKRKLLLTPEWTHRFAKAQALEEKKLIFLAVLNATELVTFEVPAMPSLYTIEKNFYNLMTTAGWLYHAEYTYKQVVGFPQFIVRRDTQDLLSLSNWITSLEDIKDQVIKKDINRDRAAFLAQKEAEIRKEIGVASTLHRAFTPNLARWSLDFAGLKRTDETYNRYVKVLCTPLVDSFVYEIDELRDIEEFLECNLPAEHPQVISVMAQIRLLIKECKKGFQDFAVFDNDESAETSFTIIEEDGEGNMVETSTNRHLKDIPSEEPKLSSFATRSQFLIATAKWKLSLVRASQATTRVLVPKTQQPLKQIGADDV